MSDGDGGRPRRRDAELVGGDALRAYALMSVVVFHIAAGVLLLDTGAFDIEGTYGRLGGNVMQALQTSVYVFFALSAFLLSRPFVRSAMYGTPFPSVRRYARHRVGRIVPAFWAIVLVILVIYGMQGSGPGELIAFMGFAQIYDRGNVALLVDHAWSLDVEMLFYVVLAPIALACAWLCRRGRFGPVGAAVLILAVASAGGALQRVGLDEGVPLSQSALGGLRSFLAGILLAVLVVRFPAHESWRRLPRWTSAVLVLIGLVLLWRTPYWAPEGDSRRVLLGTVCGGCILGAVVVRQYRGLPVWRIFRGPLVAWLGERSYSIFLVHGVVLWALRDVGSEQPTTARRLAVALAVMLPAMLAAAQVLHVLVERPMMQLSRRPRPKDRRAPSIEAPPPVPPVPPVVPGEVVQPAGAVA